MLKIAYEYTKIHGFSRTLKMAHSQSRHAKCSRRRKKTLTRLFMFFELAAEKIARVLFCMKPKQEFTLVRHILFVPIGVVFVG